MKRLFWLLFLILFVFSFSACDENPEIEKPSSGPLISYVKALEAGNEVFLTFNYFYTSTVPEDSIPGVSVNVTPLYPLDSFPKVITISFDPGGVNCSDGVIRKGTMVCRLSRPWNEFPSKVNITFNQYSYNNTLLDGMFEYSTRKVNDSVFSHLQIPGANLSSNEGNFSYIMDFEIKTLFSEWGKSLNPFSWETTELNQYSGTDFEGKSMNVIVEKPLFFNDECENGEVTKGIIRLYPDGGSDYSADFGNGYCDKTVSIKWNGVVFDVQF